MKYNKNKIIELRNNGLTIREIMKKLNIKSPSTVQHHIKYTTRVERLIILPERYPSFGDKDSELLCAGFNEYRRIMLEKLKKFKKPVA